MNLTSSNMNMLGPAYSRNPDNGGGGVLSKHNYSHMVNNL